MVYIGGEEGSVTEIRFEKCKDGVTLYRDVSVQSTNVEEEDQPPPLSPDSKSKEMSALSEVISSMAGMRMDDQRCSLNKVQRGYLVMTNYFNLGCIPKYDQRTTQQRKQIRTSGYDSVNSSEDIGKMHDLHIFFKYL